MFLLNILLLLSIGIGYHQFKKYRALQKRMQHQAQMLDDYKVLLGQLTEEKEQWLEQISTALHSNLKSKIHAIDIAVYRLKKQLPPIQEQAHIGTISVATSASLKLIDELGNTIVSPKLYTLGWLEALRELAKRLEVVLHINTIAENTTSETSNKIGKSLYMLIKSWLVQSVNKHQASEIIVEWKEMESHWQLIYQDNGQYSSNAQEITLQLLERLSALQANIEFDKNCDTGRAIILTGR